MRHSLALFLLFGSVQFATAQTQLDSLYAIWQDGSGTHDVRVAAYEQFIVQGYSISKPDTVEALVAALHRYAEVNDHAAAAAIGYELQGAAYMRMGVPMRAVESFNGSLTAWEGIGDRNGIATNLDNIGLAYMDHADHARALEYFERALKVAEEIGNDQLIANVLSNIGMLYADQGNAELALDHGKRALAISEKLGIGPATADLLLGIGRIYYDQGDLARALEHFERSLLKQRDLGADMGVAENLNAIGLVHLEQGNDRLAMENCLQGLTLAEKAGLEEVQEEACHCLYRSYKHSGNSDKAVEYFERYIVLRQQTNGKKDTKKRTELAMQHSFDLKEADARAEQEIKDAVAAEELQQQKLVRNGFMGGFAVVLLFAGVFLTQRNRIGKEKARSEELLLNILPEEVAEELKAKGSAEAVHIDQVTVLFTDFKGFTAMSEVVTPRQLVHDLHECFSAFDRIAEKYGIEKIKTIGDAYMAAGGLPTPNTTHATDVIQAAFAMRDFIAEGKAHKIAAGLPYFEIRIGVHTGPVVAGIVGVKKFSYDIWGDTVNTASRMESSGEVGQVNISEATYELVKNAPGLEFTPRGRVQAKGKGEMEMYFVAGNFNA